MPDDLYIENGKDPAKYLKDAKTKPVDNSIDGFVLAGSPQEVMHSLWDSALDKDDFQLLLGRELESFGYKETLDAFERESGVKVRNQVANKLKMAVLSGDWLTCIETLDLVIKDEDKAATIPDCDETDEESMFNEDTTSNELKFILYQQIYLELLEKGQVQEAITLLRERIRYLCTSHYQLQSLSSWFLCENADELKSRSGWLGVSEGRRKILASIGEYADHRIMMPEHYLAQILSSHTAGYPCDNQLHLDSPPSLLRNRLRGTTTFELKSSVKLGSPLTHISHCHSRGEFAYGTAEGSVGYVSADNIKAQQVGKLGAGVTKISHNSEGDLLLASSIDNEVIVFDNNTETLIKSFEWPVLACAWYKGLIVAASEDQTVRLFDLEGDLIEKLDKKANDLVANGDLLYLAGEDSLVAYKRTSKFEAIWCVGIDHQITSLYLSHDGETLAVDTAETTVVVNAKTGKRLNEIMVKSTAPGHIIRSCLAANFLIRGFYDPRLDESDSCSITYVWSWRTGQLIEKINVSSDTIVAAAWDHERRILALASEDHHIYFLEPEVA